MENFMYHRELLYMRSCCRH